MASKRWRRRKDGDGDESPGAGDRTRDDDSVSVDDADSWWTGQGSEAHDAHEVASHLGPRTADEIREAFKRKRKRPDVDAKPHGSFQEYYSADSLFTTVADGQDPELFDPDDPYVILGVPISATWEQITAAHRRLAKLHHPDRLLDATPEEQAKSEERMAEINIAYAELRRRKGV